MGTAESKVLEARALQYRDYPEELKAAVIAAIKANGGNVLATSKLFNIPRDTVNYWWHNSERFVEIEHASAVNLADKLENIANVHADSIAAHDLSIVAIRDKAAVMDVAIKNMQLLRGQATSIVEERIDPGAVLVLMSNALGIEDPAAGAIDVTPEPQQIEGEQVGVQQFSAHK